jgi:hypothetical protein
MFLYKKIFLITAGIAALVFAAGCGIYSFHDTSIPVGVKTVYIAYIDNKASYINPQLSSQLTDAFTQMVANQTKLKRVNDMDANYVITSTITDYSVSTSGVSTTQASQNRLTVGVHIILNEHYTADTTTINDTKEYDVSGNYDFNASLSLQQAESQLMPQILKDMSQSMFNKVFSNW